MATTAGTTPDDVRGVIETVLTDAEIQNYLDDAEFDVDQANDTSVMTPTEIVQLEKYLAALKIVSSKDPAVSEESVESVSITYDASTTAWLRSEVSRRDPSGTLAASVIRDSSRHIATTSDS